MSPRQGYRRKLLVNDRVKATVTLTAIMGVTICIVFGGIEWLHGLKQLNAHQRKIVDQLHYPLVFKAALCICLNFICILAAYLYLSYRNWGFFSRLHRYFDSVAKGDYFQCFPFRKRDATLVMKKSMGAYMKGLQDPLKSLENELRTLRTKVDEQSSGET